MSPKNCPGESEAQEVVDLGSAWASGCQHQVRAPGRAEGRQIGGIAAAYSSAEGGPEPWARPCAAVLEEGLRVAAAAS